ncbi:hypothetical protein C2E23DRAFT_863020 [Lenzites betulinus]|nr:hypothetical protein C2E23DRAFT_863020 [Lenzites betulinus]
MTEKKLQAVTERPIRMPEGHSDSQRVLSSDDDPETEIFQDLIMDTGSNISWLFSEDFRIMWLKDDHASTIPPTLPTPVYRLFFRDDVTGEYDHQGYYTSPAGVYSNPPAKPILTYYVDDPTRPGWREGSDIVTLAPELADIRINGSFLWDSNGLFWGSPQTEFRFGVCFGATRGVQDLPPSGTAVGAPSAPSFMSAFDQYKELLPPETVCKRGVIAYAI